MIQHDNCPKCIKAFFGKVKAVSYQANGRAYLKSIYWQRTPVLIRKMVWFLFLLMSVQDIYIATCHITQYYKGCLSILEAE